jgi:hypothetical protein
MRRWSHLWLRALHGQGPRGATLATKALFHTAPVTGIAPAVDDGLVSPRTLGGHHVPNDPRRCTVGAHPTTGTVCPDDVYYLITDPPTNGIAVWRSRARPTPGTATPEASD